MAPIQEEWQWLADQTVSTGQKARLTQLKNHYTRLVKDDPEGAALLLAIYELQFGLIQRNATDSESLPLHAGQSKN